MAERLSEIQHKSNLTGIDPDQLLRDIEETNELANSASSEAQKVSSHVKMLEQERGYNRTAFNTLRRLMRQTPEKRRDWWLTIKAGVEALELDRDDLVDLMEASPSEEEAAPRRGRRTKQITEALDA